MTKFLVALGFALPLTLSAQLQQDPNWPCIQRLVMDVSPFVIWAGPDPSELGEQWRQNSEIAELVAQLTSNSPTKDQYEPWISEFAEKQASDQRNQNLTILFHGVWHTSNQLRKRYINKIMEYTRHQNEVAAQVESLMNKLADYESEPEAVKQTPEFQELESRVYWHQRIFSQREQAIIHLCERPILIEESLGEIARTIMQYLDI